jgi:hypothetical protein
MTAVAHCQGAAGAGGILRIASSALGFRMG